MPATGHMGLATGLFYMGLAIVLLLQMGLGFTSHSAFFYTRALTRLLPLLPLNKNATLNFMGTPMRLSILILRPVSAVSHFRHYKSSAHRCT